MRSRVALDGSDRRDLIFETTAGVQSCFNTEELHSEELK